MNKNYGILVRSDQHQVQKTYEDSELATYLNENKVKKQRELKSDLSGYFLNSKSSNRCQMFMVFPLKDYAAAMTKEIKYIAVSGVEGGFADLTRGTKYVSLYLTAEKDLLGDGFHRQIFGMQNVTEEEVGTVSDPQTLLKRPYKDVDFTISRESTLLVARIVEKLWAAQEQTPQTRFVILLDNAKTQSMELLRQIYLMIPQRLRLQLGFQTNIGVGDLDTIHTNGLPIYLLTMEPSAYESVRADNYSFPISVFDVSQQDQYSYDENRIRLLESFARNMQNRLMACVSYAEKCIMTEKKTPKLSSFKYYQEILDRVSVPGLFWWDKKEPQSIEQLYEAYQDQAELMEESSLHETAMYQLYTQMIPQSNFASEAAVITRNHDYPNRDQYLEFLRNQLYYGKEIEALQAMIDQLEEEKAEALSRAGEKAKDELDKVVRDYDEKILSLKSAHEKKVADLEQEKASALAQQKQEHDREYAALNEEFQSTRQELKKTQTDAEAVSKELAEEQRKNAASESKLDAAQRNADKLQEEVRTQKAAMDRTGVTRLQNEKRELQESLQTAREDLEKQKSKTRAAKEEAEATAKTKTIFLVTTIVAAVIAVAGIIAAVYFVMALNRQSSDAESENSIRQSEYDELSTSIEELQTAYDELGLENEELQTSYDEILSKINSELGTSYESLDEAYEALIASFGNAAGASQTEAGAEGNSSQSETSEVSGTDSGSMTGINVETNGLEESEDDDTSDAVGKTSASGADAESDTESADAPDAGDSNDTTVSEDGIMYKEETMPLN